MNLHQMRLDEMLLLKIVIINKIMHIHSIYLDYQCNRFKLKVFRRNSEMQLLYLSFVSTLLICIKLLLSILDGILIVIKSLKALEIGVM